MPNDTHELEHSAPGMAKRSAETLRDLRAGLVDDVIVRADAKGVILFVSESCRVLGYDPKELTGLAAESLVHPDDREKFWANSASIFNPDVARPADRLHRYRCADGSWVWLEGHPTILPGHDGRQSDILNIFRVVTEKAA